MGILKTADDFLMDRVIQPFSHKFQRLTGKTNFWLAKMSFAFSVATVVVWYMLLASGTKYLIGISSYAVGAVAYLVMYYAFARGYDKDEEEFFAKSADEALMNPRRISRASKRKIDLVWTSFVIIAAASSVGSKYFSSAWPWPIYFAGLTFAGYFESATPLPPCKGKVKEWLQSFGKVPELAKEHN